jgi:hypothetical protein
VQAICRSGRFEDGEITSVIESSAMPQKDSDLSVQMFRGQTGKHSTDIILVSDVELHILFDVADRMNDDH